MTARRDHVRRLVFSLQPHAGRWEAEASALYGAAGGRPCGVDVPERERAERHCVTVSCCGTRDLIRRRASWGSAVYTWRRAGSGLYYRCGSEDTRTGLNVLPRCMCFWSVCLSAAA